MAGQMECKERVWGVDLWASILIAGAPPDFRFLAWLEGVLAGFMGSFGSCFPDSILTLRAGSPLDGTGWKPVLRLGVAAPARQRTLPLIGGA